MMHVPIHNTGPSGRYRFKYGAHSVHTTQIAQVLSVCKYSAQDFQLRKCCAHASVVHKAGIELARDVNLDSARHLHRARVLLDTIDEALHLSSDCIERQS